MKSKKAKGWFFAENFHQQVNPNNPKRVTWLNPSSAVGYTNKYASSQYTVKTVKDKNGKESKVYNFPYTVTAHKFGVDIPDNAYLTGVKFRVSAKISEKADVDFPRGLLCIYGNAYRNKLNSTKKKDSGWHNGLYLVNPKKNLSTNVIHYDYELPASALNSKVKVADLKKDIMGIDLIFDDETDKDCTVFVQWVALKIDYEVPKYELAHNYQKNSKNNPTTLKSGVTTKLKYTLKQSTNAYGGTQQFKLDMDWGSELVGTPVVSKGSFNTSTNIWSVNCNGKTSATLSLDFKNYTIADNKISLTNSTIPLSKDFYYHTISGNTDGYNDELVINHANDDNPPHKRHTTCFVIDSLNYSNDTSLVFSIKNDNAFDLVDINLAEGSTDSGVSISATNKSSFTENDDGTYQIPANTNVTVTLTVPSNEQFNAGLLVCIRPKVSNLNNITVTQGDSGKSSTLEYFVNPPYSYHFSIKNNNDNVQHIFNQKFIQEDISFTNHRIASKVNTTGYWLPCRVKDGDATMIEDDSKINMYLWDEVDYIGCVPVEHHHYNPKSTYKDSLIDTHYKNNRYMGKQLASDESIDLNIKLHPKQVTTIQGLIDMDKPIPINANHKCFEGDALNHRGWAEIYNIQTSEVNPRWYECKIDVKYLTHNLNTRFKINRGDKTFSTFKIPSLLAEINSSGDAIGNDQSSDYFIIDTDGTYAYIEDEGDYEDFLDYDGNKITWLGNSSNHTFKNMTGSSVTMTGTDLLLYLEELGYTVQEPTTSSYIKVYEEYDNPPQLKNSFSLDEGQHISIKSREPLSTVNQISFSWMSSRLTEIKENNISRVYRLIDAKTNDVVFEYEYCDFDFSNYTDYESLIDDSLFGILSCRAIGRVKNQEDYEIVFDEDMNLSVDVESNSESYVDEELGSSIESLQFFGSTLNFQLNNTKLTVIDEGYNGKEIFHEDIQLEGNQYYYEAYWVNKNTDGEDNDITSYIDVVVQDSILESNYSDKYQSMYISPFPVKDKKVIFTRKAEEGILYYLDDDSEEFSYLIEPYYQYLNGVDLRAESDGDYISVFNLNYGYKTIYLENGLVSLGINRLNGRMYLRRYDPVLKEYVQLYNLELTKYDDININSISDDRIELQASDSTIIMYRGHPYVIFKHPTEDIKINTKSYQVWGQDVDDDPHDYPVMFDLMNKDNLLPVCVTSKLDDDCVTLTETEVTGLTSVTLSLSSDEDSVLEGTDITLTCTGQPSNSKVALLVKKDDEDGFDEIQSNTTGEFTFTCDMSGSYQFIAVYVGDDTYSYAISDKVTVDVDATLTNDELSNETATGSDIDNISGNYKLTMKSPSTFTYRDNQEVVFTLTKGGVPVQGKTVERIGFGAIYSATTNSKGQVSFKNDMVSSHVGNYTIGARYWEGSRCVTKVFKKVKIKKATPNITLKHGAVTRNNSFAVYLQHKPNSKVTYPLAKKKVDITVNGNKKQYKTNENGVAGVKITDRGTYKYKVVFLGNKDYNKATFTYREGVS